MAAANGPPSPGSYWTDDTRAGERSSSESDGDGQGDAAPAAGPPHRRLLVQLANNNNNDGGDGRVRGGLRRRPRRAGAQDVDDRPEGGRGERGEDAAAAEAAGGAGSDDDDSGNDDSDGPAEPGADDAAEAAVREHPGLARQARGLIQGYLDLLRRPWIQRQQRRASQEERDAAARGAEAAPSADAEPEPSAPQSYLGQLDEVRGHTTLANHAKYTLPLIPLADVVLFPGETLPMRVFSETQQALLRRLMSRQSAASRHFVVVHVTRRGEGELAAVGTSAEIVQQSTAETDAAGLLFPSYSVAVVARGRQRVRVLSTSRCGSHRMAEVVVLPDPSLPLPAPLPLHARALHPTRMAHGGRFSRFILQNYDQQHLVAACTRRLQSLNILAALSGQTSQIGGGDATAIPDGRRFPVQFAFWLAANLPLADSVRQRLLEEPTTVQRLQLLLRLMRLSGDCTDITCAQCRRPVSSIKEVFLMSRDGAIGNFVNPHGYIHQTVTMRKAANLALHGVPCEQDSWFPGYAWIIASCDGCHSHMGWKFVAVERGKTPSEFWGLRRAAISWSRIDTTASLSSRSHLPFGEHDPFAGSDEEWEDEEEDEDEEEEGDGPETDDTDVE